MKKSDRDWCVKREAEWKIFGGKEVACESAQSRYQGYAKVKFTINMSYGNIPNSITERQDIGDGYGGVIDYFKSFPQYKFGNVVKVLELSKQIEKNNQKISVLQRLHENKSKVEQQSAIEDPEKGDVGCCSTLLYK